MANIGIHNEYVQYVAHRLRQCEQKGVSLSGTLKTDISYKCTYWGTAPGKVPGKYIDN